MQLVSSAAAVLAFLVAAGQALSSSSMTTPSSVVNMLSIATSTTTGTSYQPTAFLPPTLQSFSTCNNGTSTTAGTASDLALLAALLNTNITQEMNPMTLYQQTTIPANGTVSYALGSVKFALAFTTTIPENYTGVGLNYIYDMMEVVRLCCAVSGFQYCTGTTFITLGIAEDADGGKWSLGANISYSGMPALSQN